MKKSRRYWLMILATVLILAGLVTDGLILKKQNDNLLAEEESQLTHLAESIDRNIQSYLTYRISIVDYEHNKYANRQAEEKWLRYGNADDMLENYKTALVDGRDFADDVVIIKNGAPVLSASGKSDYYLDEYLPSGNLIPCINSDGSMHILLLSEEDDRGIRIGVVLNEGVFYHSIVSSDLAEDKWILLLDAAGQVMVHYQDKKVLADPIDAVTGATCGPGGIEMIKSAQLDGASQTGKYEYWDAEKQLEHVAYMNIIPSEEAFNEYFAIGVAGQIDDKTRLIQYTSVGFMAAMLMIAAGMLIIALSLRWHSQREKEQLRELEFLREKNAEMRELEERRAEIAHIDRLETIGTLTSSIAHEFNNIMTPVMAYSLLSLEKVPEEDNELGDYLEEIYNAAKRAKVIVSRLSDLSRKNTDKSFIEVNLYTLIEKAHDAAFPAKPKNVEVEFDADKSITLVANELQLHQMLLNMILNSFQAMSEKGGRLTIEGLQKDNEVWIIVSDNGPGIPKSIQEKVFDPFFTTKGSGLGTGLGLAICKQAVDDHKGSLTLESEEGAGCKFTVKLPVKGEH